MSERSHTFAHRTDELGPYHRSVTLADGKLTIEGHDLGEGVREAFGHDEYEFVRTLDRGQVQQLRAAMGVGEHDDLIDAIAARFADSPSLERFIEDHDIASEFWSRIGA